LEFESHVFDIAFHPSEDIVAAGLITGEVHCYKLNVGDGAENSHLFSSDHHKKSCRALAFSHNGDSLYTASKDKSLQVLDSSTGKLKLRKADAHDDPLNCLLNLNENLLASGDDGGAVKIWDLRQKKKVISWKENQDFISDMSFVAHKKTLVVTSGDGCLSIFDIRKPAPVCVSDNQDDELLSVAIVKNYKKAVVGTQDGVLSIFSWGNWGDCTDRFPGHPSSIDAIVKIDENTICTGSSDGLIRVVGILPNRLIGILGDHGEGMPIERLKLSGSNSWIGSCSHDSVVKFWDVASSADDQTHDNQSDEDDDDEDDDEDED
ncbi:WD40-repeat-containing domain protein, partial [Polychytrium aggregatum]|uniref:WD40-repeat-containing domain protein n=1 Tax=Polychytrium aggregatum TaxID=110093 RepID=UPI0022FDE825